MRILLEAYVLTKENKSPDGKITAGDPNFEQLWKLYRYTDNEGNLENSYYELAKENVDEKDFGDTYYKKSVYRAWRKEDFREIMKLQEIKFKKH